MSADTSTDLTLPDLPTMCPRGHSARDCELLPKEGVIAIRCRACPANYVMVGGRWFEAPETECMSQEKKP